MNVRKHCENLEDNVKVIEAGLVDVSYKNSSYAIEWIPNKVGEFPGLKQSFEIRNDKAKEKSDTYIKE